MRRSSLAGAVASAMPGRRPWAQPTGRPPQAHLQGWAQGRALLCAGLRCALLTVRAPQARHAPCRRSTALVKRINVYAGLVRPRHHPGARRRGPSSDKRRACGTMDTGNMCRHDVVDVDHSTSACAPILKPGWYDLGVTPALVAGAHRPTSAAPVGRWLPATRSGMTSLMLITRPAVVCANS